MSNTTSTTSSGQVVSASLTTTVTSSSNVAINTTTVASSSNVAINPTLSPVATGLSPGPVAGIAIGTAIIGALIAAAVVFFIMGHRRKKGGHSKYDVDQTGASSRTRSRRIPSDQSRSEKASATADVGLILPQPLDDKTIEAHVEKFFKFVEGHLDSGFYHDKPVDAIITGNERLGQRSAPLPLGVRSQSGIELQELLADQSSRQSAITCLICAEALSGVDFRGETERSLLPAVVTSFIRATDLKTQSSHAGRLSLSRWRTSTSFLLGNDTSDLDKDHRDRAIQLLLRDLNEILRPFAFPEHEDKRTADLTSIFKRAEKLGLVLLSQPAEWVFEWRWDQPGERGQSRGHPRQSLVVFPGLLKLTDSSARVSEKPTVVLDPRVQALSADTRNARAKQSES